MYEDVWENISVCQRIEGRMWEGKVLGNIGVCEDREFVWENGTGRKGGKWLVCERGEWEDQENNRIDNGVWSWANCNDDGSLMISFEFTTN